MSVGTLLLGFTAWPPTADRDAAPPLASTPDRPEIPIGIAHAGVAEIGGKHRKLSLDVDPLAIPTEERADREPMPEVVYARPAVIGWAAQPNLPRQSPEDPVDVLMQQSAAALGDEEVRTVARSEVSIAPFRRSCESHAGCRMQGYKARLAELGLSNRAEHRECRSTSSR